MIGREKSLARRILPPACVASYYIVVVVACHQLVDLFMMQGSYVPPNLDTSSVVGSVAMSAADSKLVDAGLKSQSDEARRKQEERNRLVTIVSTAVASMASKFE